MLQRPPCAPLRPFVARLWAGDADPGRPAAGALQREHVLPTGLMHVVIRLADRPLHLLDPRTAGRTRAPLCLVGGARSSFHARETAGPSCSVGAVLRPGAAALLFGVGADGLAHRHTGLDELWDAAAGRLRDELCELPTAEARLARFEARLGERLPWLRGPDPQVAALIACLHEAPDVGAAVRRSGLSHRRFIANVRHAVGLAPKEYLRVQRLQQALRSLRADPATTLAGVAALAGYSDQSHFGREFLAFAGVTPAGYRANVPVEANHLLLGR